MNSQLFVIWFAGFFEGEGSVSNCLSDRNRIRIHVAQNDPTPLLMAQKRWGGTVTFRTRVTKTGKICEGHEWCLGHWGGLKFLEDIGPYMIVPRKIAQVDKCLAKSQEEWTHKFKCCFCDKEYTDPSGVRRHEQTAHIARGERYKCTCGFQCAGRGVLKKHIRKEGCEYTPPF